MSDLRNVYITYPVIKFLVQLVFCSWFGTRMVINLDISGLGYVFLVQ